MRLRALEPITEPASKPQIGLIIGAAFRHGNDMVKLQQPKHVLLWTLAISTSVPGLLPHPSPDSI